MESDEYYDGLRRAEEVLGEIADWAAMTGDIVVLEQANALLDQLEELDELIGGYLDEREDEEYDDALASSE